MRCKASEKLCPKHKKGLWSPDEDQKLKDYVLNYGHSCWSSVPINAGTAATWVTWSQIAQYLPGRTDNEIKNYWHSYLKKRIAKLQHLQTNPKTDYISTNMRRTIGINYTTATINHTSTPTVVTYHTGPPHLDGPTVGPVPPGFPPKVHYTTTVPPTSITVQPGNVGLTALSGQATTIPHAFTTETLRDFSNGVWNMDTGASSHLNSSVNSLCENFDTCMYLSISVGGGHSIPVTNTGHSNLPTSVRPLHLKNFLITPQIVKNLIYVRQFVRDSNCTIEFDAFGFSVKDFMTRRVLLRCDSTGDLYWVTHPSPIPRAFLVGQHTWHQHLGHPGGDVLRRLVSINVIFCNNEKPPILCHACQLGKHVRLPFVNSNTVVTSCFEIIHLDVWTSPILSLSGFKYYVLFLDHYSHSVPTYGFLDDSPDIPTQLIQPILVLNPDNIHVTHTPPPNTNPTDTNITPLAEPESPAHATPSHNSPTQQSTTTHDTPPHIQHTHVAQQTPKMNHEQPPMAQYEIPHLIIPNPPQNPNLDSVHPMVMHFRVGTNRPTERLNLHVSATRFLVFKPCTIRMVLSLAVSRHWPIHQLDVKNTFLHGDFLRQFICISHQEFSMTDLSSLNYFLGISVTRDSFGMFLSQKKYAIEILEKAHMVNCSLQYLTFTRSDISYAVQPVCLYMHDPRENYFSGLKRVPSAKAEYRGVTNAVAETCWLRNLLRELHTHLSSATLVYCDNVSDVYLSSNPVQHQRTKHIEIDIHFFPDLVAVGQVCVLHVPSRYQFADIFTKGLPSVLFEEFRTSLSVWCPSALTAGKCLEGILRLDLYHIVSQVADIGKEIGCFRHGIGFRLANVGCGVECVVVGFILSDGCSTLDGVGVLGYVFL
nr:ribonuclease H-like domain-containing protein [Tanacetum cinerariifolium]